MNKYERYLKYEPYLLMMLLLIPVLVLFFYILQNGGRDFYLSGDEATLECRVVNAAKDIQYIGPYSRFGWNHLGPSYFYILLPFYLIFSMSAQSLYVGATFIGILALALILYALFKTQDLAFYYFIGFALIIYIYYYLGLQTIRDIWNPYVTMLPFIAFLFLSAHVAIGRIHMLPLILVTGSFIIQTHIAYTTAIAGITGIALLMFLSNRASALNLSLNLKQLKLETLKALVSDDTQNPSLANYSHQMRFRSIILSVGFGLILWILPFIESFKNVPGNVVQVVSFFLKSLSVVSLAEAVKAVSKAVNGPFIQFLRYIGPDSLRLSFETQYFLFALLIVVAVAAVWISIQLKKPYYQYLLIFCLYGIVSSIFSVTKIDGGIHPYLTRWMSIFGVLTWCTAIYIISLWSLNAFAKTVVYQKIINPFSCRLSKYKSWCLRSIIIFLAIGILPVQMESVKVASAIKAGTRDDLHIGVITEAIKIYCTDNHIRLFHLKPDTSLWIVEAGVITQLYKSNPEISFTLDDIWLFWFGYQFARPEGIPEKDVIVFIKEEAPPTGGKTPGRELICHHGSCSVYHVRKRTIKDEVAQMLSYSFSQLHNHKKIRVLMRSFDQTFSKVCPRRVQIQNSGRDTGLSHNSMNQA